MEDVDHAALLARCLPSAERGCYGFLQTRLNRDHLIINVNRATVLQFYLLNGMATFCSLDDARLLLTLIGRLQLFYLSKGTRKIAVQCARIQFLLDRRRGHPTNLEFCAFSGISNRYKIYLRVFSPHPTPATLQ